jgi:tuberculosinol/isotuberculosinol synthase
VISYAEFLHLSSDEVAKLVRAVEPQVCVLAVNGTRRWFRLEYGDNQQNDEQAYVAASGKRYLELCQMCFDHGLDTLISPVFSASHLTRSGSYMQKIGIKGLVHMATHPDFLDFYQGYNIRVRFYGDYRKRLAGTPFADLCDLFDEVTKATAQNSGRRLFFGLFANDATETIGQLSIEFFQKTGRPPTREELVELYYGEHIQPASLFIGFSKLRVYDYPLLNLGQEDLYFTVAPSLYLNEPQLRSILYDHIYLRRIENQDYAEMSEVDFQAMQNFYLAQRENTLGVGTLHGGIWVPDQQIPEPLHMVEKSLLKQRQYEKSGSSDMNRSSEQHV